MAIPASGWTSVSSIWFEQESGWRWQAVVAVLAEQDRLQEEYNIGAARLEDFATSPPVEMDSNIGRINTSKRWSPSSAERGTICDQTEPRRSEQGSLALTGQMWSPRRWRSCRGGSRPHLPGWRRPRSGKTWPWLPSCQRSWQQEGRSWRVQRGDAANNWRSSLRSDQAVEIRLRGVRVGEASNPGPQSTRIVSEDEPILAGRSSPRRHGDSDESVLIPGFSLDGFESVAPQRSRRRGGLPNAPLEAVHPIQVASACQNQCRGRQRLRRQGQVGFRSGHTTSRAIC